MSFQYVTPKYAFSIANVGAASTLSTGSVTARTFADRFDDTINVLDWLTAGQPDGATDNTTQLQAAITAAAGKSIVYFPRTANNYIHTGFTLPSNTHLIIDGYLLTKSTVSSSTSFLITTATGASNIIVEGSGTFDGNKANLTTPGQGGIVPNQATNVIIRGLTVKNTFRSGVYPAGCTNCLLEDLKISNTGNSNGFSGAGQFGGGGFISTNCWARNCFVDAIQDLGFGFYDGAINSGITNCTVTNTALGNSAIFVMSDGGTIYGSNILIDSNIIMGIVGSAGAGISVSNGGGLTGIHNNITISNNQMSIVRGNGIDIAFANNVSIINNMYTTGGNAGIAIAGSVTNYKISGNTVNAANGWGMQINGAATRGSITNNHISNTASTVAAILLNSSNVNTYIANNYIFGATPGIVCVGTLGTGTVITSNRFTGVTTPYSFTNAADTILVKYGDTSGTVDFTTNVTAPTQTSTDNSTKVATTAFVTTAVAGATGVTPVYFQACLSADQAVTAATLTKVVFNTEVADSGGYYDNVTNFRFTPLVAGRYRVSATVRITCSTGATAGTQLVKILKNTTEYSNSKFISPNANNTETSLTTVTTVAMNGSTDFLEVWAQNPGTVGQVFGGALPSYTHFEAERIGA
jgi:hypothetical protein